MVGLRSIVAGLVEMLPITNEESKIVSESSDQGRDYESHIASQIRHYLKVPAFRDKKSGGHWTQRSDIRTQLPFHFEAKHQKTIKVKEWFRQADNASPGLATPVVIFKADEFDLCVLKFRDLLNLIKENRDYERQAEEGFNKGG